MQFNITFKTIFEYILTKLVLCIQIRFVSTEKTTRIVSRASCSLSNQSRSYYQHQRRKDREKDDQLENFAYCAGLCINLYKMYVCVYKLYRLPV